MTNKEARKVLQEVWRNERTDYESVEVKEAIDRAIRELGNDIDEVEVKMNNQEIPIGTTVHINPEDIKWRDSGDLISRSALKDKLTDTINVNDICKSEWYEGYADCIQVLSELIDNAPTLDNLYQEGHIDGMLQAEKLYARPQGDLISREALKKHKVYSEERHEYVVPVYNIDNASTVEAYPFEQVQELVKLNQQFAQEIINLKKLQGEWVEGTQGYYCSECGNIDSFYFEHNFCHNCGARMGGKEE